MLPVAVARSRKWLITINNPADHGFDHDRIKAAVLDLPGVLYWCMCDEQGDECETLHTHVYFVCENQLSHTQVDARFPTFHRDVARGKSVENRAYVLKDGDKFNKQPDGSYSYKDTSGHLHEGINFSDTFEEGGEMPVEQQGKSRDADIIVELIKSGATNEQIVDTVASAYREIEKVERVRSMYRDSQFKNCWRDLEVTYIFGKTGSGKTRGVMDRYGYENCYRVTDYKHPFDTYDGQDVLIFEEFRCSTIWTAIRSCCPAATSTVRRVLLRCSLSPISRQISSIRRLTLNPGKLFSGVSMWCVSISLMAV